ncbi:MAG: hypothetical protein IKH04_04955 [Kiritimatiellae bacterium]|nr:hypothetical protein [Kiritimatiellia bacterium]
MQNISAEAAKHVGASLYFSRGNAGFRIRCFNGEIDVDGIARQIDSMLTSTPTTYCPGANWPTNAYIHGSSNFFVEGRPKLVPEVTAKEAWKCYDREEEVMKSWM